MSDAAKQLVLLLWVCAGLVFVIGLMALAAAVSPVGNSGWIYLAFAFYHAAAFMLCFFHVLHADVYGFDARRASAACGPHLAPPGLRPLPSPPLPSNPGATQHLLVRLQRGPGGLLRDRRPPERAVAASHLQHLPPSPLLAVRVGTLGNVLWFPSKWGEHPEYENSVGGFGGGMN